MAKSLKFKFESGLQHQLEAIDSVVNLFNGFSQQNTGFQLEYDVISNIEEYYDLDESWLYDNYQQVVANNNKIKTAAGYQADLEVKPSLTFEEGFMLAGVDNRSVRYPAFTVEMETGTGKTYTYLRTILELKAKYNFRKYIVVVPSIAIYEGTIKAFKQTKEHFKTLFGNEAIHLVEYDGRLVSKVRGFANSTFTQVMIMTLDSFNKTANNIYKTDENLRGEWLPYQYIQATRPILILDESQNYRSEISKQALRTLNPLFALNYSATPVDKPNQTYRLSPVDAFRHNLVKKIKVLGVTQQHNLNDKDLSLTIESINKGQGLPTATIQAYCFQNGSKIQQQLKVKKNDDLYKKTNNEDFKGFIVEDIDAITNSIHFTNQSILKLGDVDSITLSKREIYRVQIEETIKFHFQKQKQLLAKGIKVLSLFFIDRVANYKGNEAFIKDMFESAFNRLKQSDDYFKNIDATEVHKGYFAQKKGDSSFLDSLDLVGSEAEKKKIKEAEKEAFRLIMKEKEELLKFSEKTSFIFAHSALREGWDNPNVFNICLLKEPNYDTENQKNTRRQEIGRGLRICVNQDGERLKEDNVNVLTIVCPEDFSNFISKLQEEYTRSGDIAPPAPSKAKRDTAKRNDKVFNSKDFRNFWNNLSKKTEYIINIESEKLIQDCINRINSDEVSFPEPQVVLTRGEFVVTEYSFTLLELKAGLAKLKLSVTDINGRNDKLEQWYSIGYDFGRKIKDKNLSGFRIVQIDQDSSQPALHFGNNIKLFKGQQHNFSGDPTVIQNQRATHQATETFPVFNLIKRTSSSVGLTRPTIISIFKGLSLDKKIKIFKNPEGFASVFIKEIKEQLANHVAEKIEYHLSEELEQYELEIVFPEEKEYTQRELIAGSNNSLYDQIQTDSDIERNFVTNRIQPDDENGKIVCYFKFPSNFKVRIPKIIGNYNPDWGIIRLDSDGKTKIQLVRETKGNINPKFLQYPNEKRKIDCAKKHFQKIGIKYRQIDDKIETYWLD